MRKLFRRIHLWLSVPFGLLISIICLSGAALVFETEITEGLHSERFYVEKVGNEALPVDFLLKEVVTTLPDSVSITGVTISSDPERAYQVSLSKPRRASVYIDQYTGEVKAKSERGAFFLWMFRMHRWLLDSMKSDGGIFIGKLVVGVSTLVFVFVLISGIVIWIPRSAKMLKNRLKIVTCKGWRRFWYDLHVSGGMYATVFLLVMALTGLTWSFPWYRTAFYKVFGVEMRQETGGHAHHSNQSHGKKTSTNFAQWQKVYNELSYQNPANKSITISHASAKVVFDRWGNQLAADTYSFNPRSGNITEAHFYNEQDNSGKIRGWIYSVHVGSWGGMFTRVLAFLAAFMGGVLPLTGYYLWFKRSWKRRKQL